MRERDVFIAAIEAADPSARAAILDQACQADRQLRARVEQLLMQHDRQESFLLDVPPVVVAGNSPSGPAEQPGAIIGPYKLLQQIGEGGMGVVFMAEQAEPLRRTVALKIIKPGMDTRQVVARFEAERQALASMDHPNIAQVLDAGATEGGRPYFVMELVKGVPITQYCEERGVPLRERLALFATVCRAVQHAHQKGIIHRDLKPSNVLAAAYDGRPVAKIIDFGVAKATGPRLTERTLFTEFGAVVGTLEYMSPEQAELNQLDVDTRSDIYGLGVLLYELLTGTTPLTRERVKQTALVDVLRAIREEEPPKPSARLSSAHRSPPLAASRQAERLEHSALVRGELDWVVMKALAKDRNRRYATASSVALDLERYLADEPVEAAPPSPTYRARKFAMRHKAGMLAAALAVASLLAGTGVSIWHARLARRAEGLAQDRLKSEQRARQQAMAEAAKATAISTVLQQMLQAANPAAAKGSSYTVRQMLDEFAVGLGDRLRDQPHAEAAIRATIGNAYRGLQSFDMAEPHLLAALELKSRQFGPHSAEAAESLVDLAANDYGRGDVHGAAARTRGALAIHRALKLDDRVALRVLSAMQFYLVAQTEYGQADALAAEALQISARRPGAHPEEAAVLHNLAHAAIHQGRPEEGEALARRAVALHERLEGPLHPETAHAQFILGKALHDQLRFAEAAVCFRQALTAQRRQFDDCQTPVLAAAAALADTLRAQNDQPGLAALRATIDLVRVRPEEWESWYFRGSYLAALGEWQAAEAAFAQAAERRADPSHASYLYYLSLVRLAQGNVEGRQALCTQLLQLAAERRSMEDAELAVWACMAGPVSTDAAQRVLALVQHGDGGDPEQPAYLTALGAANYRAGRYEAASQLLTAAVAADGDEDGDVRPVLYGELFLAMIDHRQGRPESAQRRLAAAVKAIERPSTPGERKLAESWHATLAVQLVRREAEELARRAEAPSAPAGRIDQ